MFDVPERPLRAVRFVPARYHDKETCPTAWVYVSPPEWTDAQRRRAQAWANDDYLNDPKFTPDCSGCEDVIAWQQWHNAMERKRRV